MSTVILYLLYIIFLNIYYYLNIMRIKFNKLQTRDGKINITFDGDTYTEYSVSDIAETGIDIPTTCKNYSNIKIKGKSTILSNLDVIHGLTIHDDLHPAFIDNGDGGIIIIPRAIIDSLISYQPSNRYFTVTVWGETFAEGIVNTENTKTSSFMGYFGPIYNSYYVRQVKIKLAEVQYIKLTITYNNEIIYKTKK